MFLKSCRVSKFNPETVDSRRVWSLHGDKRPLKPPSWHHKSLGRDLFACHAVPVPDRPTDLARLLQHPSIVFATHGGFV